MGQRRDMPLDDGKVPGGYGAFGKVSGAVETAGAFGASAVPLGSVMVKVDPIAGSENTAIEPSWDSTACFVKTNPSPMPSRRGFVVTKGWKSRARVCGYVTLPVAMAA